jgi:hypothetical protein
MELLSPYPHCSQVHIFRFDARARITPDTPPCDGEACESAGEPSCKPRPPRLVPLALACKRRFAFAAPRGHSSNRRRCCRQGAGHAFSASSAPIGSQSLRRRRRQGGGNNSRYYQMCCSGSNSRKRCSWAPQLSRRLPGAERADARRRQTQEVKLARSGELRRGC